MLDPMGDPLRPVEAHGEGARGGQPQHGRWPGGVGGERRYASLLLAALVAVGVLTGLLLLAWG